MGKKSGSKKVMTGRERVLKALNYEPVDRIPVDQWAVKNEFAPDRPGTGPATILFSHNNRQSSPPRCVRNA